MGRGETVLVVEDDPEILKLCHMLLEQLGYRVLVAGRPSEAIGLAEAHAGRIDLLLTDVDMPEMSGQALAHRLRPTAEPEAFPERAGRLQESTDP